MANFFTSDLHLGHKKILQYCPMSRAAANGSIDRMKELIIDGINKKVGANDTLYILGDVSFATKPDVIFELMDRIVVKEVHLILGNHDQVIENSNSLRALFSSVSSMKKVRDNHDRIILCHYPIESWDGKHYGYYHLHGHTHSRNDELNTDVHHGVLSYRPRRLDVGIDSREDFAPWSWDEIKEFVKRREEQTTFTNVMEQGV